MPGVPKRRGPSHNTPDQAVEAITQAQFMVAIYAEIVAMDQTILERIRQLLIRNSHTRDSKARLINLRLALVHLDRVGERLAFWNGRVHALVETQLG